MTTNTETTPVVLKTAAFPTKEQYLAILATAGLQHSLQSGFIKVEGPKGNRLYVAATKTVRRVDISGFEVSFTIAKVPHCGPFGQVKQQMIVDGTVEEQLARFEKLLTELKAQSAKVPALKVVKAPTEKAAVVKAGPTAEEIEKVAAAKAARIALIKKVAAEKGMLISSQSMASATDSQ